MVSEPQRPLPFFDPMASNSSSPPAALLPTPSFSLLPVFVLPNMSQGNYTKLEGSNNYLQWLTQFMIALRSYELMGIVDGSEPCPPQFLADAEGKTTLNPTCLLDQERPISVELDQCHTHRKSVVHCVWT
jgi:hypothetical protein